jgi:putative spermidine/putrescine transport system permease protein
MVNIVTSPNLHMLHRHAERRDKIVSALLTAPYLLFIVVTFVLPIALLLFQSVQNPEISKIMPKTAMAFREWTGNGLPQEALIATFVQEMRQAQEERTITQVAKRLNFEIPGFRSMLLNTGRAAPKPDEPNLLTRLSEIDERWAEARYWIAIKHASPPLTLTYLLAALDLRQDVNGEIVASPPENQIYRTLLARTLWIGLVVTSICLLFGYPVAYLLAAIPTKYSNLLMLLLLLPFWTSLLVRTTAWLVLLQNEGIVNQLAIWAGLWGEPIQLIRNRIGVYVAMTHILLPFMVLPIFSVMKGISPTYVQAAFSLGARPFRAFTRIYLPQTLPGVGAGVMLVFIMSLGYYITPALVGGPEDQMLSHFIAFNANTTLNWSMAGALSIVLLTCVGVLFFIFTRLIGVDRFRIG